MDAAGSSSFKSPAKLFDCNFFLGFVSHIHVAFFLGVFVRPLALQEVYIKRIRSDERENTKRTAPRRKRNSPKT